jgi:hypothetical protein
MFKSGCGMANTGTLCISIIILVIVIILIVMVCYNYNQTQNTQTTQPYIQNPGLAAAYRYKNNFAKGRRRAKQRFGNATCAPNTVGLQCNTNGKGGTCALGVCVPPPSEW